MMIIGSRTQNFRNFSFICFILFLTCPIAATSALADTNLVVNPGFEIGSKVPINWTLVSQNGIIPIWDNVSHSGSKSVKISISGRRNKISGYPRSDLISVSPLTEYSVSVWGKTQNAGGTNTPAARVVELDANKNRIRQTNLPAFGRGTNNWTQKTIQFQTHSNTKYLYIYANILKGYGTFWLDDVEIRLKNTPTPTVTVTPVLAFIDDFDSLDTVIWGKEYSYPAVSGGFARFNLNPGTLNSATTWSKLSYKDEMFGYGTYSMTFKYNRRPSEAEVWAGWALYSETSSGLVNEINFGIETACVARCTDQSLIFETYKNSKNAEIIIPTGASLFDGSWHTGEVIYTASNITIKFDRKQVATVTDTTVIPTNKMELIPGARVINGKLNSAFYMDVDRITFSSGTTG